MTKLELIEKLSSLPGLIAEQEIVVINANLQVQDSKNILTEAEDVLILSGQIDGKNAETRKAQMRAKTVSERGGLQKAENQLSIDRARLNRLNNELAAYKAIAGMLKGAE
jgi:hypothetical protein